MKSYNVAEAADFLKCGKARVRELYHQGILNGCRAGRGFSFTEQELLECRATLVAMERAERERREELKRRLFETPRRPGAPRGRRKPLPTLASDILTRAS